MGEFNSKKREQNDLKNSNKWPSFSHVIPQALEQILEVAFAVIKLGHARVEATYLVAKKRNIAYQTVLDKYCRQLGKRARDIDRLFQKHNLVEFRLELYKSFPYYKNFIESFFNDYFNIYE